MKTLLRIYVLSCIIIIMTAIACMGQSLELQADSFRIRYQNMNNTWTHWDSDTCTAKISILPEYQMVIVENELDQIFSINTHTINSSYYESIDYEGQPLVIRVKKNNDKTYNILFHYQNTRDKNGGMTVVGYDYQYLNCTLIK
jgi:hypothetical protein